jgi:hypothetical protein
MDTCVFSLKTVRRSKGKWERKELYVEFEQHGGMQTSASQKEGFLYFVNTNSRSEPSSIKIDIVSERFPASRVDDSVVDDKSKVPLNNT